jgi:hypothetical protein
VLRLYQVLYSVCLADKNHLEIPCISEGSLQLRNVAVVFSFPRWLKEQYRCK